MQFRVPKFLEREAKIAFGLTFKKLGVLGAIALVLFILWYAIPNKILWFLVLVISSGAFLAGVFVKVGGQSIPELLRHSFRFFLSSKTYMWQRKDKPAPIKFVTKKQERETKKAEPILKIAPESKLGSISSSIEMGTNYEE